MKLAALLLPALALCAAGFPERPDQWVTGKVLSALVFTKEISGQKVEVDTKEGVVTLRGKTDFAEQRDLAAEQARGVEGVKDVVNLIEVKTEDERRDEAITASVQAALVARPATRALRLSISTTDGVVTLDGPARSRAQQEFAEKAVRGVPGVRGVENKLTIEQP